MNPTMTASSHRPPQAAVDALQARFALKLTAKLSERANELAPDLNERLRFARETALERTRAARRAEAVSVVGIGTRGAAVLGRLGGGWWLKAASIAPMLVLAAGLFLIQRWQEDVQISTAAEVDAALLADDLPPTAYGDVGFAEFLKTPGE